MSRIRRIGLAWEPPECWPLDQLFVGIATLRTVRQLFRSSNPKRAWDLSLWSGVTPQGSADALARMERLDLVVPFPADRDTATGYALDRGHHLYPPLAELFRVERANARSAFRRRRRGRSAPQP